MEFTEQFVAEEAARIRDEDHWPRWPMLPVKKRRPHGGYEVGVLVAGRLSTVVLVPETIFALGSGPLDVLLAGHARIDFDSIEAMIRDGWVGD